MRARYLGLLSITTSLALAVAASGAVAGSSDKGRAGSGGKIPITAASAEARNLYLEGRTLLENLRLTDARARLELAVARDPGLALAWVGLANSALTTRDFFAAVSHAAALVDKVSPGEKDLILALEAGGRGDPAMQKKALGRLVAAYPDDERARTLLGNYHFGRQEYPQAIVEYERALAITPDFAPTYNQLGYAYRFVERYPDAEKTFRRYTELVPGDPNPHDSYAELLMKTGRFEASIESYRKALATDPGFASAAIGIANNQIFLGQSDQARKTLDQLLAGARNPGERRQALFWLAVSHVHDGATDKAIEQMRKERAVADEIGDKASAAQDLNAIGTIQLEASRLAAAARSFDEAQALMAKADVPADVKAQAERTRLYFAARTAIAASDHKAARAAIDAYGKAVADRSLPFELRQHHEIQGALALAGKDYRAAVAELEQGNHQDPRALYDLGLALAGAGDAARARDTLRKSADFNALAGLNYGFVRARARARLAEMEAVAKAR